MPTYEYACKDCGTHFDIVQSFSDDALTVCPSCEGNLRKVFSAAGIIFKGSGWHIKDYADASSRPATTTGESTSTPSSGNGSDASAGKQGSSGSKQGSPGGKKTSSEGKKGSSGSAASSSSTASSETARSA